MIKNIDDVHKSYSKQDSGLNTSGRDKRDRDIPDEL